MWPAVGTRLNVPTEFQPGNRIQDCQANWPSVCDRDVGSNADRAPAGWFRVGLLSCDREWEADNGQWQDVRDSFANLSCAEGGVT
jgi:hypothetical protein